MRLRLLTRATALLLALPLALTLGTATADAATGPKRLQHLARQQTGLLLSHYADPAQTASPSTCNGSGDRTAAGAFLLPTLSLLSGDEDITGTSQTFRCRIKEHSVVLDLGGAVVTEDATGNTFSMSDGRELPFTPQYLEEICDDVLVQDFIPQPAPATLDGAAIGGTAVSTPAFVARVSPTGPFYDDSQSVGHPGRLATSFCGWKTELRLRPGHHTITVDLSALAGDPVVLTYQITVVRH